MQLIDLVLTVTRYVTACYYALTVQLIGVSVTNCYKMYLSVIKIIIDKQVTNWRDH